MKFDIQFLDTVTSTNSMARSLADKGAPEGTVLSAEFQSQGRGKPGHTWLSSYGKNLLFSVILRPPVLPNRVPELTQIACRSAAWVLKEYYGINSAFKRPNDILVEGKKICGTLVESCTQGNKTGAVIVGIGLNVNDETLAEVPGAVSMKQILGRETDRKALLDQLLTNLAGNIESFYSGQLHKSET